MYYKDYRVQSYLKFSTMDDVFARLATNMVNRLNSLFAWKYQRKPLTVPCYILKSDPSNAYNYLVSVKAEYSLAKASKYPQYNISKQVYEISNGSLTDFVCIKECEVGHFYEFESLSCRKCNLGCGVCSSFEECEECIPGYNKKQISQHHGDIQEDYPVGFCRPGCQPGFYPVQFNGRCVECPANCRSCRDKKGMEVTRSQELGIENMVYCNQCRDKSFEDKILYSELATGECVHRCEGFGTYINEFVSTKTGRPYRICGKRFDPNCEDCGKNSGKRACLVCRKGYAMNSDWKCELYWRSERGTTTIATVSLVTLFILVSLSVYVMCKAIYKKIPNSEETLKRYRESVRKVDQQLTVVGALSGKVGGKERGKVYQKKMATESDTMEMKEDLDAVEEKNLGGERRSDESDLVRLKSSRKGGGNRVSTVFGFDGAEEFIDDGVGESNKLRNFDKYKHDSLFISNNDPRGGGRGGPKTKSTDSRKISGAGGESTENENLQKPNSRENPERQVVRLDKKRDDSSKL